MRNDVLLGGWKEWHCITYGSGNVSVRCRTSAEDRQGSGTKVGGGGSVGRLTDDGGRCTDDQKLGFGDLERCWIDDVSISAAQVRT
jgi:hypothetical protein